MMPTPPLTPPDKSPEGVTKAPPLPPRPAPSAHRARPLQPRTPQFITPPVEVETEIASETIGETQQESTEGTVRDAESFVPLSERYAPKVASGPKRKCPNCLYFPMTPLAQFSDKDIEKTYRGQGEYYYQTRPFYHIIPFSGLIIGLLTYLGNLLFATASDSGKRAKVHRAKAEILSRCPNSLICPECCEVLEIY